MSKTVKKHFDDLAHEYDGFKKKNSLYYESVKKGVAEALEKKRTRKILDVGCGTGEILSSLNPKMGLGIDNSREMIKMARRKFAPRKNLAFSVFDIEKKPFPGRFDAILLVDVVEHLTNPDKALKNIAKSISEETILVISMANPLWEPFLMLFEKLHLKMPEGEHHRISEAELFKILKLNYLRVLSKKTYLPSLNRPILNNLPLIFVYKIVKE